MESYGLLASCRVGSKLVGALFDIQDAGFPQLLTAARLRECVDTRSVM